MIAQSRVLLPVDVPVTPFFVFPLMMKRFEYAFLGQVTAHLRPYYASSSSPNLIDAFDLHFCLLEAEMTALSC